MFINYNNTKIIICADDYALTPWVSRGIVELIAAQRVSATSVMVASEYFPETYAQLLPYQAQISIGLHITLTDHVPLSNMPQFAPDGKFPSLNKLIKAAYLRQLPLTEIRQEIREQINRFYLYFGFWPMHVDGHHHVQVFPGIRQIVIEEVTRVMGENSYIRNCCAAVGDLLKSQVGLKNFSKAMLLNKLSQKLKKQLCKYKINTNTSFAGVYDFNGVNRPNKDSMLSYADVFSRFMAVAKDGMLIMVHPGYEGRSAILKAFEPVGFREKEMLFLKSAKFLKIMQKRL